MTATNPEEAWRHLQAAIDKLLDWTNQQPLIGPQEALQLYTQAYNYCTEKREARPGAPYYLAHFYGEDLHRLLTQHLEA